MSGIRTEFHYSDHADEAFINRVQDVEPILEQVHRIARDTTPSKEMRHVARFPMIIVEQYCNANRITFEEWSKNPEHADRMLRDPALSKFRIRAA